MPTEDISGEISKCVLQAEPVENGNVQGGGVYTKGEFALLKAEPNSGYRFSGWYEGDKLLSSEAEYRFRMETDRSIRAVFQKVGQQILFDDVPEGKWFSDAINWAAEENIMAGYVTGQFQPNAAITRQQFMATLYKYARMKRYDSTRNGNIETYEDVKSITEYAIPAMQWAVGHGVMTGNDKNRLMPKETTTREQMVAILASFDRNVVKKA